MPPGGASWSTGASATDQDLRSEQPLGEFKVLDERYAIRYNADQIARAEKLHADLFVISLPGWGSHRAQPYPVSSVFSTGVMARGAHMRMGSTTC
jgi:hypothetical protein